MVETRFDCPADIKARFVEMCALRDETPGAMMRLLMRQELKSWAERKARKDEVRDEALLARLRLRVAECWTTAQDWDDFLDRLYRDRLVLKPKGGGLAYFSTDTGTRLAKASDVGPSYSDMIRRFRRGFPGHPQPHIAQRVLLRDMEPDLIDDAP